MAKGGSGGLGGGSNTGGSGGSAASGFPSSGINIRFSGGNGGNGATVSTSAGGGGGSSAGEGAAGANGGSTSSNTAGTGGGAPDIGGDGANGGTSGNNGISSSGVPGGAGGGSGDRTGSNLSGGAGSAGRVVVIWEAVSDNTAPSITCPANVTVNANANCQATGVSLGTPTTSDNCSVASTTNNAPSTYNLGNTTVVWKVTDGSGNTATCSQIVTVVDATAPTITCPANLTISCAAAASGGPNVGLTGIATAIDNCSTVNIFWADQVGSYTCFASGYTVTRVFRAEDLAGNVSTCIQTITVAPGALPTMTAPSNITVACGAVPANTTISYSNGLSGNCLFSGSSNISTMTATPGSCGGTITQTWTATDACGRNLTPVSRTITVSPAALPTMTAPADVTVECGAVPANTTISYSNGLSGNCLISGNSNTSTMTATPGACGGTITQTWTATDACGRSLNSVSRTITVNPAALPTMTALANTTVECGAVPANTTISYSNGLSGNCLMSGTSDMSTMTATPGACGGTITQTWTATDGCGRALASVSRTITVSPATLPTMTAPNDITVECGAVPANTTLSFSNNLSGNCLISGTSNTSTMTATPGACGGTITQTWTATDVCGRVLASVSRTITVNAATLPTMTAPNDITVECGAVPANTTISYSNGLSGNCLISGTSNTSTMTATPGACGGTITQTWTATDNCGRTLAPVSRTITVNAATLPTMTAPANTTVECGAVPANTTISYTNGLSGNCLLSGVSNTSTMTPEPSACGGTVTQTWTASDACGRSLASVSRQITINPAALPTMTAPNNITVACGAVPANTTISYSNGLSGNCLISGTSDMSTMTATPGACGGTITQTWTATDGCGRALASVSRTITVSPATLPTMTAPNDVTVECGAVPANTTLSFSNNLSGNCLISGTSNTSTMTATPGACGGTITQTWTATDNCGRTLAPVSRTITVNPATLPTMTAPADVTVECGAVPANTTISYSNGLSGNCLISGNSNTSTMTATPGACGGTITQTWTATDNCGRALASVSRTITVNAATLPTMTAPANTTVECGAVPANTTISYTNGLSGNCLLSGVSNTSTMTPEPSACGGPVTQTWTATDACGRALASVSRQITINPAALPTMTAPADITVACGAVPANTTISYSNGLSGNCLISGTSDMSTMTATPGACGGTITQTWTATDGCGRALASVSRTITVSPATLPTMTAPNDITVACGAAPANTTIAFTNGLSGNCLISGNSNQSTMTATPGVCGGTITQTWTATDACGRTLVPVTRTITVSPAPLPTFATVPDITVECGNYPNPTVIAYSNGQGSPCSLSGVSQFSTKEFNVGQCGGTITETWEGTDQCGRTIAPRTRTIYVEMPLPFIIPQNDTTVACGHIPDPKAVVYRTVTSGGPCAILGLTDVSTQTAAPGACGGDVTETWTATDLCGRTLAPVTRTIHVQAAPLPTLQPQSPISVACNDLPAVSRIPFSNGASGGCLISGLSNLSTISGSLTPCGSQMTETWTAVDECGRTLASVSRIIVVQPADLPTMTAPSDITVACGTTLTSSTLTYTNGRTDLCLLTGSSQASTFSAMPGACGGVVTETWNGGDECGRTLASVSRTITVLPATLPTMTPPANTTVSCGNIPANTTISYTNGLSGNCLISGISDMSTTSPAPGACGGTVLQTWSATDQCGRTLAPAFRIITVLPAALPTMTAPADITVACGAIPANTTISYTNGLSGNCLISGSSDNSTMSAIPGACGGSITQTWTATDACNRSLAPVSRTITVLPATLPTMSAPANVTVACGAVPANTTISYSNGLSGNCLISGNSNTSTMTATPGACGGTITETWTATDNCNRTVAPVSRTITVLPATLPTLQTPANVTVACGDIPANTTISYTNNLSGNCLITGVSQMSTLSSTPSACGGVVLQTWAADDACGRTLAPGVRLITVLPAALPTMTAPADITVECGAVPANTTISYSNNLSGNCLVSGNSNTSTMTVTPGSCGGTITQTWTATDACNRPLQSVSRQITVLPASLPTMTAPADITVACGAVPANTTISYTNGLSGNCLMSGNSNNSTMTSTPNACGGQITETWTATDACNRPLQSVSRTITVLPATLPTMSAPADITVACGSVPANTTISYTNNLSGNCLVSGSSNTSTMTALPGACGGNVTETWTATDACGRTLSPVSRTITVLAATLPTLSTPDNITVACGDIPANTTIGYSNGLSGGCLISGNSNTSTKTTLPGACGGLVTETWTATDVCGRTLAPVSRTIRVLPAAMPTLTVQQNVTVSCGDIPASSFISYSNGLSGNCLLQGISNASTKTPTPGACGGTITETWTATDACGRTLNPVTRTITVLPATLPTMTAPLNATVACGDLPASSFLGFSNGLSGNCLLQGTSDASTLSTIPDACGGTVSETWTAHDACGRNLVPVSRTLTVLPAALSTMTAPADITVECGAVPANTTISYSNNLSGNCLISGNSNTSTMTATPGACGGTITQTWTATDACGRTIAPVSRTITVNAATLPTMTAPANTTVECGAVPANTTISYTNGLSGNCLLSGTSNTSTMTATPDACGGTITQTWTATDACGRSLASVSRTITVNAAALPTMTAPANTTVECGAVPANTTISYTNGLSGNCLISGVSNTSSMTATPGACGGTITQTWTATDNCGRTLAPVTRTITVNAATLPTMTAPANTTVECGAVPANTTISYTNGLSGNCLIIGVSNTSTMTATPGACGGTITQTWTATDACGRALTSVSRTITVNPAALPTMTAPLSITVPCNFIPTPSVLTYSNNLSGGCLLTGVSAQSTLSAFPGPCGGSMTETWTATDACGRALAPVTRTISVQAAPMPTMSAPGNITVACGALPASSTLNYSNGLSGGCGLSGVSNTSFFNGVPGPCGGIVTEVWTATDACGRPLFPVTRIIQVLPAALPVMSPPPNLFLPCGTAVNDFSIPFTNGLSGQCMISGGSNLSTSTALPGPCGGTVTQTWTATDLCGRQLAPVSRTITFGPAQLPTMTAPGNITVNCGSVPAPSTVTYTNNQAGNCLISGTSNMSSIFGAQTPCGTTLTEVWTATDVCNRTVPTASRTITVLPAPLPTMTAPATITVPCGSVPPNSIITYSNSLSGSCALNGNSNTSTMTAIPGACGGQITQTWTATDACNRQLAPVSRTIIVLPATLPTMTVPNDITVACGAVPANTTISYSNNLSGNCLISGNSNTSTMTAIPGACGGTITQTWTATDVCNRALAPVSRTVTVLAATLPTMTAPADITVACGAVPANTTISYTNNLSGNCLIGGSSNASTMTATPGACGGTITETWTATDACNRVLVPVSRTITVLPATLPTMTAPANLTVACGAVPANTTISYSNNLSANCLISGNSNTSTMTAAPGACGGSITETWTATDNCYRTIVPVSRTITVLPATLPTMTAPSDVTVECGSIPNPSTINYTNNLSGGCLLSGTSTISSMTATPGVCGGTITETWTAMDACGRAVVPVSRTITVKAAALPSMTAPDDITVACGGVPSGSTIAYTNGLSGACQLSGNSATSTFSAIPNGCGTVTETWTATDACGRAIPSVSRTITIADNTAPVITTCPPAFTVDGCSTASIPRLTFHSTLSEVTSTEFATEGGVATDVGCGVKHYYYIDDASGSCEISNTRTWVVSDACGNSASCSQIITIHDVTAPSITCPATAQVNCNEWSSNYIAGLPTVNDNCDANPIITHTESSEPVDGCEAAQTITRVWIATDHCGNSASCTQIINVVDMTAPTIVCPDDVTLACGVSEEPDSNPSIGQATATDNCSSNIVFTSDIDANSYSQSTTACHSYSYNRIWIATDECGNASSCSQHITVVDLTAPTMACPSDVTVSCLGLVPSPSPSTILTGDGCGSLVTVSHVSDAISSSACANKMVITRTYKAEDACGNSTQCMQIITVDDQTPPTLTTPSDVTVSCEESIDPDIRGWASAVDQCSFDMITPDYHDELASQSCANTKVINRIWVATDACGNSSSSVQVITVQDLTAPQITTEATDGQVQCSDNAEAAYQTWLSNYGGASAQDNCGTVTWTDNHDSQSFTSGCNPQVTVTFTATDECGNSSTTSAVFTYVDTTPPTIACHGDIEVYAGFTVADATLDATATDNCNAITYSYELNGAESGSGSTLYGHTFSAAGNVNVTWTATDACGNSATCTFVVHVVGNGSELFGIECTGISQDRTMDAGSCYYTVQGDEFDQILNDDCPDATLWVVVDGDSLGVTTLDGVQLSAGNHEIAWHISDNCGNNVQCSFTVRVTDDQIPTAICKNATIYLDNSGSATLSSSDVETTFSDNCAYTVVLSRTAYDCSNVGTNVVKVTVTDNSGNTASCSSIVTVVDNTPPSITCPASVTVYANANDCGANLTLSATATDNCASHLITRYTSGNRHCGDDYDNDHNGDDDDNDWHHRHTHSFHFPVGTTTVTAIARDNSHNQSTCSFTVTVIDNTPPTARAKNIYLDLNSSGFATLSANQVNNGSYDACGISTKTVSPSSFNCSNVGVNTVTLTVWDTHGNSASTTAIVTVRDRVNPAARCKTATIYLDATGTATLTPAQVNNGSTDACGIHHMTVFPTTFHCTQLGTRNVLLSVYDVNGNVGQCWTTVLVKDIIPPTIACPADMSVSSNATNCSKLVCLNVSSADNCSSPTIVKFAGNNGKVGNDDDDFHRSTWNPSHGCFNFPVGTTTVRAYAYDKSGNSTSCSFKVTVVDNTPPVARAKNVTVYLNSAGSASVSASQVDNNSNDNCSMGARSVNPSTFNCSNLGQNTVVLTVSDAAGNTASTTAIVSVRDNINPVARTKAKTVYLNAAGTASIVAADVDNASSDNCAITTRTLSKSSFNCGNVGANVVYLTVGDASGNVDTEPATVTVIDNTPPTAIAKNISVNLNSSGSVSISASMVDNGSTDVCGISSRMVTPSSFSCSNRGNNTVVLRVTDVNGNTATTNAIVVVRDVTPPTAICKNVTLNLSSGSATLSVTQVDNGSTDNCGIATRTLSKTSFSCADAPSKTVVLTVTDASGNSATCTSVVTINGLPSCSITATPNNNTYTGGVATNLYLGYGPTALTLTATPSGGSSFTYSWSPSAGLSCSGCQSPVFTPTAAGTYTYTVTTTNNFGCQRQCTITICVKDIRVPGSTPAKVWMVHSGTNTQVQTSQVSSHLSNHNSDYLGKIGQGCSAARSIAEDYQDGEDDLHGDVELHVSPNPYTSEFSFVFETASREPASIKLFDMAGRVVDEQSNLTRNTDIHLGNGLPNGVYLLQFTQGTIMKTIRVLKID